MNAFTIKDIENLSGIKAHTIRIWEQRYQLLSPQRTATNIRFYTNEDLQKILNIALLNKYGYKISHINQMSEAEMHLRIAELTELNAKQEQAIHRLIQCTTQVLLEEFELILNTCFKERGIDKTIEEVVFPFLERVGMLWQTSHVNPAQEHLISNLIRQKLVRAVEEAVPVYQQNQSVILFLPEGEHHELGLLYVNYLLKQRGNQVYYLGANTPIADLIYLTKKINPNFIFTHLTSVASDFKFTEFLKEVQTQLGAIPLIVSGVLAQNHPAPIPANTQLKNSLAEVVEFFS